MIVLALDQAPTRTGFAIGSPGMKAPVAGLFKLPSWGDEEGARLLSYENWLSLLIARQRVTHIFREQLYPIVDARAWDTIQQQAKVVGLIELTAARHKIPLAQVLISDWRKRFLGTTKPFPGLKGEKARAWFKQEACAQCARRGWLVDQADAAEACGILDFGLATLSREYAGRTDVIFRRAELQRWRAA